jgi:hypothetical protein
VVEGKTREIQRAGRLCSRPTTVSCLGFEVIVPTKENAVLLSLRVKGRVQGGVLGCGGREADWGWGFVRRGRYYE